MNRFPHNITFTTIGQLTANTQPPVGCVLAVSCPIVSPSLPLTVMTDDLGVCSM